MSVDHTPTHFQTHIKTNQNQAENIIHFAHLTKLYKIQKFKTNIEKNKINSYENASCEYTE